MSIDSDLGTTSHTPAFDELNPEQKGAVTWKSVALQQVYPTVSIATLKERLATSSNLDELVSTYKAFASASVIS